MRQPEIVTSNTVRNWSIDKEVTNEYGYKYWVPARPESLNCIRPFWHRFMVAWLVLIGKYDALKWGE